MALLRAMKAICGGSIQRQARSSKSSTCRREALYRGSSQMAGIRSSAAAGAAAKLESFADPSKGLAVIVADRRKAAALLRSRRGRGLAHIAGGNAAHKIAFAERHAQVAQNVVGGDDMEIEMRDRPVLNELQRVRFKDAAAGKR